MTLQLASFEFFIMALILSLGEVWSYIDKSFFNIYSSFGTQIVNFLDTFLMGNFLDFLLLYLSFSFIHFIANQIH